MAEKAQGQDLGPATTVGTWFSGEHLLFEVRDSAKKLALSFAGKGVPPKLREAAFRVLASIQGDTEIEDLFVDYLVECEQKDDPLRRIADGYWG